MKNSYDRIAGKWDSYMKTKKVPQIIRRFAGSLPKGANILDIGCGSGMPIAAFLADAGFSICGIDSSEEMLRLAQINCPEHAEFHKSDLLAFSCGKKYDAAVAFDSLFHIENEAQEAAFQKAASLLKKGGLFLFTHGKNEGSVTGEMFGENFCYFTPGSEKILLMLKKYGFSVLETLFDYSEAEMGSRELIVIARKE
ncbi:MAG: class I SAM-dependent methyltransferase [Christensenellaceae bacterium]|nr:class I SAM-dependent methyltransferase [Christensenellaceae bacterium]